MGNCGGGSANQRYENSFKTDGKNGLRESPGISGKKAKYTIGRDWCWTSGGNYFFLVDLGVLIPCSIFL